MRRIEVGPDNPRQRRRAVRLPADAVPARGRPRQRRLGDLGHQRLLRGEVQVEPAMRQPGLVHHRVDADAVDPVLAEQRPRRVQDPLPRVGLPRAFRWLGARMAVLPCMHDDRHFST